MVAAPAATAPNRACSARERLDQRPSMRSRVEQSITYAPMGVAPSGATVAV